MSATAPNRIAGSDRRCICGAKIAAGDKYYLYRERALTSHEAIHAGPYPTRRLCLACIDERNNETLIARAEDDYADRAGWKALRA